MGYERFPKDFGKGLGKYVKFQQVVHFSWNIVPYRSVAATAPAGAAKTVHAQPEVDPASLLVLYR